MRCARSRRAAPSRRASLASSSPPPPTAAPAREWHSLGCGRPICGAPRARRGAGSRQRSRQLSSAGRPARGAYAPDPGVGAALVLLWSPPWGAAGGCRRGTPTDQLPAGQRLGAGPDGRRRRWQRPLDACISLCYHPVGGGAQRAAAAAPCSGAPRAVVARAANQARKPPQLLPDRPRSPRSLAANPWRSCAPSTLRACR